MSRDPIFQLCHVNILSLISSDELGQAPASAPGRGNESLI